MTTYASYPSLMGRTVMITGGGSGIGASLVEHFVQQKANVAFVDIAEQPSQMLVDTLSDRYGNKPLFIPCDVTDTDALETTIDQIAEQLGTITVLVNNAGNDERHDFKSVSPQYWDQRMQVLVKHQFFAAKAVYDGMQAAGGGSIINFSSTTWLMGEGGYMCYTTAKAAIYGMTWSLARDFGPADIRVNAVLPGWIMTDRQLELWVTPEAEREIAEKQALKHKLYPADIARMVLFLAADDSAMTTGQGFVVDGGWS